MHAALGGDEEKQEERQTFGLNLDAGDRKIS